MSTYVFAVSGCLYYYKLLFIIVINYFYDCLKTQYAVIRCYIENIYLFYLYICFLLVFMFVIARPINFGRYANFG